MKVYSTPKGLCYNIEKYELDDEEFVEDLRVIMLKRFNKQVEKLREKQKTYEEKIKIEKATHKQIKYTNNLYYNIYEIENRFLDKDYSKLEIGQIIDELREELNKQESEKFEGKVVEFKVR